MTPRTSLFDQLLRGDTINNAEAFLEDARKSFGLAAKANSQDEVERYAALGREFLTLAHRAATVEAVPPEESFWQPPSPGIRK